MVDSTIDSDNTQQKKQKQQQQQQQQAKKKQRKNNSEPKVNNGINSKDVLQRLNFLYQTSTYLNTTLVSKNQIGRSKQKKEANVVDGTHLIPTQAESTEQESRQSNPVNNEDAENAIVYSIMREMEEKLAKEREEKLSITRTPTTSTIKKVKKLKGKKESALLPISRLLAKTMKEVAKKATLRMDPTIKRTICKKCNTVLIPGVSCIVRIKPSGPHAHLIVKTCTNCNHRLKLPAPPHLPEEDIVDQDIVEEPGAMEGVEELEVEGGAEKEKGKARKQVDEKLTKRERREKRQARKPTFFERKGHVIFAGEEKVVYDV